MSKRIETAIVLLKHPSEFDRYASAVARRLYPNAFVYLNHKMVGSTDIMYKFLSYEFPADCRARLQGSFPSIIYTDQEITDPGLIEEINMRLSPRRGQLRCAEELL